MFITEGKAEEITKLFIAQPFLHSAQFELKLERLLPATVLASTKCALM
jgi:hypothetical protein